MFAMGRGEKKTLVTDFLPFFPLLLTSLYINIQLMYVTCVLEAESSLSPCAAAFSAAVSREVLC